MWLYECGFNLCLSACMHVCALVVMHFCVYVSILRVYVYMYVSMCAFMYIPNPSARAGCDIWSIFQAEFNRFKFRVFLLLDRLPYQHSLPYYLPIAGGMNNLIHTFPKSISNM